MVNDERENRRISYTVRWSNNRCLSRTWGYHDEFQLKNNDIQKFAELLIQEAMDIVGYEVSFHSDWACADATIQKVKDHFGVE